MSKNSRPTLTSNLLRRALALRERIDSLHAELLAILGSEVEPKSLPKKRGRKPKRKMSPAGRARVAAAMRARWRKAKKAGRSSL
jgi:hypothetical protein